MRRSFSGRSTLFVRLAGLGLALLQCVLCAPPTGGEPTPTGLWRTVDDKTGKPKGLIRIYEDKGQLFGKIEASLDPAEAREHCDKCPGDRKNQPMIGLLVLRGMTRHGNEYSGGDILDPDTGWVYRCRLWMLDQGKKLQVRGFIGISLVGRSQIWTREP